MKQRELVIGIYKCSGGSDPGSCDGTCGIPTYPSRGIIGPVNIVECMEKGAGELECRSGIGIQLKDAYALHVKLQEFFDGIPDYVKDSFRSVKHGT